VKTIFALAFAFAASAQAAGTDELWEITSQMNMAGMPAGMGARTSQVCTEKGDHKKAMTQGNDKCKVTDFKQSGNSVHMAMSCPEGSAVMDTTYNAARTEYKGTMKMTSRQGEMTMTMAGRKVGTCDAQQAKTEQNAKMAAMTKQSDAAVAKMDQEQLASCSKALDTMQVNTFGMYAYCNQQAGQCEAMVSNPGTKRSATTCMANVAEYCKRYQTLDGFLKAKGDEQGAKTCNVTTAQVKSTQCPRAAQTENLAFLAQFCPAEAKPIAAAHCAGRSYTSRVKDKYTEFCGAYLAKRGMDDDDKPAQKKDAKAQITDSVTQGVTQGVNKLKGLFGR
jgi:Protein of unknown function (DUF3617)